MNPVMIIAIVVGVVVLAALLPMLWQIIRPLPAIGRTIRD